MEHQQARACPFDRATGDVALDLADLRKAVDGHWERVLPQSSELAPGLVEGMRYAVGSRGKRIRPSLVCATGLSLGAPLELTLDPAVSVELVHAYSLVHDDLPALDDDHMRRGQPSTHAQFGEANAILIGDALQCLAFGVLANATSVSEQARLTMIELLADAAGWRNMVGGQALDIDAARAVDIATERLEAMHLAKTGALLRVSIQMGAIAAGHSDLQAPIHQDLIRLGGVLGLGFQIIDDVLDVTQATEVLGKPAGSDEQQGRVTLVSLMGVQKARERAQELLGVSRDTLQSLGLQGSLLDRLAVQMIERDF